MKLDDSGFRFAATDLSTFSALGPYHYRAVDAKLAQEPRGTAVLQLCVYSEIVSRLQGKMADHMVIVSPAGAKIQSGSEALRATELRTADFLNYFRRIRERMVAIVDATDLDSSYPEVAEHCDVCSWWESCNKRRRADDHLSFVAGLSRRDQRLLEGVGIKTLTELGNLALPLADRPKKLRAERLDRLQEQARLQLEVERGEVGWRAIAPASANEGLGRLPAPSPADIFFDIESDRYATGGSFVYLFGWVEVDHVGEARFQRLWARNRGEERINFERFVDHVRRRREDHPELHVYHFAATERTALSDLSGRYASREDEVDDLLRHEVLCDLLPVVRQGVRAGVEEYSLKQLEQFHRFSRATELRAAARARRLFELSRERAEPGDVAILVATIENYNHED